jgi:hypothetical protein
MSKLEEDLQAFSQALRTTEVERPGRSYGRPKRVRHWNGAPSAARVDSPEFRDIRGAQQRLHLRLLSDYETRL